MSNEAAEVMEKLEDLKPYLAFCEEAQLADYGETAAGGPFVKLRITDPDQLDVFRGKNRVAKNKQGQRYVLMLVEIADDDTPVNTEQREHAEAIKGGPVSKNAAALCNDPLFLRYLGAVATKKHKRFFEGKVITPVLAGEYIRSLCGIESRAELDHEPKAKELYDSIKSDFIRWSE